MESRRCKFALFASCFIASVGVATMLYVALGDFTASKSAVNFTLNGNYSIYQVGGFQYESVCTAQTENLMLCGYVLPDINFDKNSAIQYSQENCISGQEYSGSYNSQTLICDDFVEKYEQDNIKTIILFTGFSLVLSATFPMIFFVCYGPQ
jgi:hypothetical protein